MALDQVKGEVGTVVWHETSRVHEGRISDGM
jgi:hypothetical protein